MIIDGLDPFESAARWLKIANESRIGVVLKGSSAQNYPLPANGIRIRFITGANCVS